MAIEEAAYFIIFGIAVCIILIAVYMDNFVEYGDEDEHSDVENSNG